MIAMCVVGVYEVRDTDGNSNDAYGYVIKDMDNDETLEDMDGAFDSPEDVVSYLATEAFELQEALKHPDSFEELPEYEMWLDTIEEVEDESFEDYIKGRIEMLIEAISNVEPMNSLV